MADALADNAETALKLLSAIPAPRDNELRFTLGDLEAMSHLGNYYAEKTRGATALAFFEKTGKEQQREEAIAHLEIALEHWQRYAEVYDRQYQPQHLTRIGKVDILGLTDCVVKDVEIARGFTKDTKERTS